MRMINNNLISTCLDAVFVIVKRSKSLVSTEEFKGQVNTYMYTYVYKRVPFCTRLLLQITRVRKL